MEQHIIVNPNAAYDKVSTEGLDCSYDIGKTTRTGYESREYEMLGKGLEVKETPQQKYQRLLQEVQELTTEVCEDQDNREGFSHRGEAHLQGAG